MPLKVRCRCGQDVVVDRGEWRPFLVGLLLFSAAMNGLLLILVLIGLDAERVPPAVGEGAVAAAPPSAAADPAPPPAAPAAPTAPTVDAGGAEASESPEAPIAAEAAGAEAAGVATTPAETSSLDAAGLGSGLEVGAVPEPPPATPLPPPVPARATEPFLAHLPRLVRLAIIESAGTGAAGGESVRAAIGLSELLLEDADPRVRLRARQALVSWWLAEAVEPDVAVAALSRARAIEPGLDADLRDAPVGRALLARLAQEPAAAPAPPWERSRLAERVRNQIAARGELRLLLAALERWQADGIDIVFAIDASESMAAALSSLRTAAGELFGGLLWALPRARLGALFFRDDVTGVVPLTDSPETLVAAFAAEDATGGGDDVCEGVYEALQASLQLGRFAWRAGADKVIVIVGDAPPPFDRKRRMLALARQARGEGRFTIHTVGLRAWDGWDGVPWFDALALAGGGRAVTARPERIAGELLVLAFPHASEAAIRTALPAVETPRERH